MRRLVSLLLFLPLGILAQVGLGTAEPTAALEIKTDPSGIAAIRLQPQSNPVGSSTGQMAVINNTLYLFDEIRGKWLSIEKTTLEFGRLGNGSNPTEIEFGGGDLQNGPRMPFDGTIVKVSITATDYDNARNISLLINSIPVPNNDSHPNVDGVYNLDPSTLAFENSNYNLDFNSGDMINMEVDNVVDNVENLIITLHIKWRKDNP